MLMFVHGFADQYSCKPDKTTDKNLCALPF